MPPEQTKEDIKLDAQLENEVQDRGIRDIRKGQAFRFDGYDVKFFRSQLCQQSCFSRAGPPNEDATRVIAVPENSQVARVDEAIP